MGVGKVSDEILLREERLKTLNEGEIRLLFNLFHGKNLTQLANNERTKTNVAIKTLRGRLTSIYNKLEIDLDDKDQKRKELTRQYRAIVFRIIPKEEDLDLWIEGDGIEGRFTEPESEEEPEPEPEPDETEETEESEYSEEMIEFEREFWKEVDRKSENDEVVKSTIEEVFDRPHHKDEERRRESMEYLLQQWKQQDLLKEINKGKQPSPDEDADFGDSDDEEELIYIPPEEPGEAIRTQQDRKPFVPPPEERTTPPEEITRPPEVRGTSTSTMILYFIVAVGLIGMTIYAYNWWNSRPQTPVSESSQATIDARATRLAVMLTADASEITIEPTVTIDVFAQPDTDTPEPTKVVEATRTPLPLPFADEFEGPMREEWIVLGDEVIVSEGKLHSFGESWLFLGNEGWTDYLIEIYIEYAHSYYPEVAVRVNDFNNMLVFDVQDSSWYMVEDGVRTHLVGDGFLYFRLDVEHLNFKGEKTWFGTNRNPYLFIQVKGNYIDAYQPGEGSSSWPSRGLDFTIPQQYQETFKSGGIGIKLIKSRPIGYVRVHPAP